MIKSMTGWGEARGEALGAEIRVEVKSVNNRHIDCNIRMPRAYLRAEENLRAAVGRRVSRGKVDVFVNVDMSKSAAAMPRVNLEIAQAYIDAAEKVGNAFSLHRNELTAYELLRFPDVISTAKDDEGAEDIIAAITETLDGALSALDASRAREGARLGDDIAARLNEISAIADAVEERSPDTVREYREKLEARLREVLADTAADEARLLTEAAIFADRTAVNEELVRLRSHIQEMRDTLARDEPVGRRLDFLVQEMNREANTVGSKVNDAELARRVVDLKAEIEKIREQAQNIE